MPDSSKVRIAKLKKRMAIPRERYIAAVERHEHRAWAYRTDPRWHAEMRTNLIKAKNHILISEGKVPDPLPEPESIEEPDPAVFDTEDQIRKDDALIEAYLSDTPDERRLPNARGHNHAELLKYWHSSPEGKKWHEHLDRELKPKLTAIRDRILAEGC
ncbi:hypothetical protein [Ruegeria arenilitoris]|uniref:hypothetical protein n=1 Tax=Ruegeria arenilitoris TaxID=1173585 RepID=UPI00147FF541|nr:hypothetical protein [Ruegeria arenilitoris]